MKFLNADSQCHSLVTSRQQPSSLQLWQKQPDMTEIQKDIMSGSMNEF